MPGATPVLGLPYPYEGEPITVADFANLANAIDAAQTAVTTFATDQLTTRPLARVQTAGGLTSASNVNTQVTFDTLPSKITDNTGMFSTGTPNRLTVTVAGVYLMTAHDFSLLFGYASVDNTEVFIYVNGVRVAEERSPGASSGTLPATVSTLIMWPLYVGDVITAQYSWAGGGGPATWSSNSFLSVSYICPFA